MSIRAIVAFTPIKGDPREVVARSRERLEALQDELPPADGRIMIEISRSTGTVGYGEDTRFFVDAGLDCCDAVEAALDMGDASAAAMAMLNLADVSHRLVMAGRMKEIFAGLGTIAGGKKGAAAKNQAIRRPSKKSAIDMVAKIKRESSGISETNAKREAARRLGIGKTLLYEILKK